MLKKGGRYKQKNILRIELGGSLSLHYHEVENGYGGYHPVCMTIYRGILPVKTLTDHYGHFLNFPGTTHGAWEKNLKGTLRPQVNFIASIAPFQDGFAQFSWMVQPNGFYYADEYGFGAEDDLEIWLYALIDESGSFVTPFSDTPQNHPVLPIP